MKTVQGMKIVTLVKINQISEMLTRRTD
jgi:hypothetical protein